jgi:hypothetical protein
MVAMTPDAVGARLLEVARRSAVEPSPMRRGVDMTPAAVTARLRDMAAITELCRALAKPR